MFNHHNGPSYKFCGYTYIYDIMDDGDVRKLWHDIVDPTGKTIKFSNRWSPYRYPTEEQFQNIVVEYMLKVYFEKEKYSVGF